MSPLVDMSIQTYEGLDGVYVRGHQQLLSVLHNEIDVHYRPPRVFEVAIEAEKAMVGHSNRIYAEGERIMKTVKTVDPETCAYFGMKIQPEPLSIARTL